MTRSHQSTANAWYVSWGLHFMFTLTGNTKTFESSWSMFYYNTCLKSFVLTNRNNVELYTWYLHISARDTSIYLHVIDVRIWQNHIQVAFRLVIERSVLHRVWPFKLMKETSPCKNYAMWLSIKYLRSKLFLLYTRLSHCLTSNIDAYLDLNVN